MLGEPLYLTGHAPVPMLRWMQTLAAVQAVGGDLSPLPFQSLLNATQDQLKCFQGGLGQATDTYNVSCQCRATHPGSTLPTVMLI